MKIYLKRCGSCGNLNPVSKDGMDNCCEDCGQILEGEVYWIEGELCPVEIDKEETEEGSKFALQNKGKVAIADFSVMGSISVRITGNYIPGEGVEVEVTNTQNFKKIYEVGQLSHVSLELLKVLDE